MEYPLPMVHPNFRKGSFRAVDPSNPKSDYQGSPDVLPPVTVNNEDQEAQYRAKGYRALNESAQPMSEYKEFPMWMTKPEYQDVLVHTEAEKQTRLDLGYSVPGSPDAAAFETATASPYVPGERAEFPKYVDGVLVDPTPAAGGFQKYPMWIGDVVVNSAAEEAALTGDLTDDDIAAEGPDELSEREALFAQAEAKGIKVDKRWNDDKIKKALAA